MQYTDTSESELMGRALLIHVLVSLLASALLLLLSLALCRRFFVLWAVETTGFNKGVTTFNPTCGYILFAVVVSWALLSAFVYHRRSRRRFVDFVLCFLLIMVGNCYVESLIVQFS